MNDFYSRAEFSRKTAERPCLRSPAEHPAGAVARIGRAVLPARWLSDSVTHDHHRRPAPSPGADCRARSAPSGPLMTGAVDLGNSRPTRPRQRCAQFRVTRTRRRQGGWPAATQGAPGALRRVFADALSCSNRLAPTPLARARSTSGPAPARGRSISETWGKAGVQVCYEIVFSGEVVDRGATARTISSTPRTTAGSAVSARRSTSPRRGCARSRKACRCCAATTSGISAVIDAQGVVRAHVPQHVPGRLGRFRAACAAADFVRPAGQLARPVLGRPAADRGDCLAPARSLGPARRSDSTSGLGG